MPMRMSPGFHHPLAWWNLGFTRLALGLALRLTLWPRVTLRMLLTP